MNLRIISEDIKITVNDNNKSTFSSNTIFSLIVLMMIERWYRIYQIRVTPSKFGA